MTEPAGTIASRIADIVSSFPRDRESLIPILQGIQDSVGYLSQAAVDEAARLTGISANEIYGVATFYSRFRFHPPGAHTIVACQGTACHVRGGRQVLQAFEQRLGIGAGQTTADGHFELQRVACIGCCALAPVAVVDNVVHARMSPKRVAGIIANCEKPSSVT